MFTGLSEHIIILKQSTPNHWKVSTSSIDMKKKNTSKFGRAGKVQDQFVNGFSDALILPFKDHFTCLSLIESRKGFNCLFNFVAMGYDVI